MANSITELKRQVRSLRITDLQQILGFAGQNTRGKKSELQARTLKLIDVHTPGLDRKIREIYHQKCAQSRRGPLEPALCPLELEQEIPIPSGYSSHQRPMRNSHQQPMRTSHQQPMRTSHEQQMKNSAISEYISPLNKHIVPPTSLFNNRCEPRYPMNPHVQFKDLPFYDVLAVLLRGTSLITLPNDRYENQQLIFYFLPQQIIELESCTDVQVQIRICLLEMSCEQDDEVPPKIFLKVNNFDVNVPPIIPQARAGAEQKRQKRPMDVTSHTIKTDREPNVVDISWAAASGKPYVIGIFLVRKLTSSILIGRLKANGVRNPDHTTATIKEKLCQDRDSEIATMSLRGSLMCPLGKIKMNFPCRSLTCTHLQCFDATLYLQMNEKKPKWICPVCDKPALFRNLAIDGLFLDIICKAPTDCSEVQFHEDGSWTPVKQVKKPAEITDATTIDATPKDATPLPKAAEASKPKRPIEIIDLDSDSDTEDQWSVLPPKKKSCTFAGDMSPVLLDSSEDTQPPQTLKIEPLNPFIPNASKMELTCTVSKNIPTISDTLTVTPLTDPLDIESSDTDCILSDSSSSSSASSSVTERPYPVPENIPSIPAKSSLQPLPKYLDIDLSNVECILGDAPSASKAGLSSGYENISPESAPEVYIPPPEPAVENDDIEILPNSQDTRPISNFDFLSLIQENFDYPPASSDRNDSPDVINID